MPTATWKGKVIAESDRAQDFDGNVYFPADALKSEFFEPSDTRTTCGWKGQASYVTVVVDGERNPDAAWFYPDPKSAAAGIQDHYAFWKGVQIQK